MVYPCATQPTQLFDPLIWMNDSSNTCCILVCAANAQRSDKECVCKPGYYQATDVCNICADGYRDGPSNVTQQSDCKRNCPTNITVGNGSSTRITDSVIYGTNGNKCTYTITCNTGYNGPTSCTEGASCACSPNQITVTYANGGGMGAAPTSQTCTYNDTCVAAANTFVRNAYTFAGWCNGTVTGGYTCNGATLMPNTAITLPSSGTITLTAMWIECSEPNAATYDASCNILTCNAGYCKNGTGSTTTCDAPDTGNWCNNGTETPCSKGYYCTGGTPETRDNCEIGRCKCPAGATTKAVGKSSITECIMLGGSSTVQDRTAFCDGNGSNCFYLPVDVPY